MTDIALTPTAAATRSQEPPLVRWGARAAVAAPVLAVFSIAVGIPIFAADMREAAGSPRWVLVTAARSPCCCCSGSRCSPCTAATRPRSAGPGHASALLALAGTALAAGGAWDSVFTVPYLADVAPAVLDRATSGSLLAGFVGSYLVFVLGWAAFAVATLRARLLPRGVDRDAGGRDPGDRPGADPIRARAGDRRRPTRRR